MGVKIVELDLEQLVYRSSTEVLRRRGKGAVEVRHPLRSVRRNPNSLVLERARFPFAVTTHLGSLRLATSRAPASSSLLLSPIQLNRMSGS